MTKYHYDIHITSYYDHIYVYHLVLIEFRMFSTSRWKFCRVTQFSQDFNLQIFFGRDCNKPLNDSL